MITNSQPNECGTIMCCTLIRYGTDHSKNDYYLSYHCIFCNKSPTCTVILLKPYITFLDLLFIMYVVICFPPLLFLFDNVEFNDPDDHSFMRA